MGEKKGSFGFKLMAYMFKLRDLIRPPSEKLIEAGIGSGQTVLDFGCGPGSYTAAAAAMVGETGRVYALDVDPAAIGAVRRLISRKGINNIEVIQSEAATGLDSGSVDVALLYDTYHDLRQPHVVLNELHRVLRPGAALSFSDHHMEDEEIIVAVLEDDLFKLAAKGKRTYSFCNKGE